MTSVPDLKMTIWIKKFKLLLHTLDTAFDKTSINDELVNPGVDQARWLGKVTKNCDIQYIVSLTQQSAHFTAPVLAEPVKEGLPTTSHHYYEMTPLSVPIVPLLSSCWCDIFSLQPDPVSVSGKEVWVFSNKSCENSWAVCRAINVTVGR